MSAAKWIVVHEGQVVFETGRSLSACDYIREHNLPTSALFMSSGFARLAEEMRSQHNRERQENNRVDKCRVS
jgi:hypothetical protein